MQRRAQISRPAVKTAAKSNVVVRRAAPAKPAVKAATPARKLAPQQARLEVECDRCPEKCTPACSPPPSCDPSPPCDDHGRDHRPRRHPKDRHDKKPCNPEVITFDCDCEVIHFHCINLENQDDQDRIEEALGTVEEIRQCVRVRCPSDSTPTIDIEVVEPEQPATQNGGLYTQIRVFRVEACDSVAFFTRTVTYTVNDGTGPIIVILPLIQNIPGAQVCDNDPQTPAPPNPDRRCECIFLGCNPSEREISAALGSAVVDRCGKVYDTNTTDTRIDGCFKSRTRTFRAKDECGNRSQACRIVRWIDDTLVPTVTLNEVPRDIQNAFPDVDFSGTEIDLGCNPLNAFVPPSPYAGPPNTAAARLQALINAILGTVSVDEVCGFEITPRDIEDGDGCCRFSRTRSWVAEDLCGNDSELVARTVSWKIDEEPPIFQCRDQDIDIECGESVEDAFEAAAPDVFDRCDGDEAEVTYVPSGPVAGPGGTQVYTRTYTATDLCGNSETFVQTVTVGSCNDPRPNISGCTQTFWRSEAGQLRWNQELDYVPQQMPVGSRLITSTNVWTYFGIAPLSGLNNPLSALDALSITGGNCRALLRQGVSALLSAAAFGLAYDYPAAVTGTTAAQKWVSLYNLIKTTLSNGVAGACANLAARLETSNNNSQGGVCNNLPTAPINGGGGGVVALKKGLKQAAPVKKAAAPAPKPVLKKAVAPKPAPVKKEIAKPGPLGERKAAVAPTRRSFLPTNQ